MDATFYAFALSFAAEHPFLTWCALWLGWVPYYIVKHTYRLIMVSLRGWPPAHLDADGDWKREPKTEKAASDDNIPRAFDHGRHTGGVIGGTAGSLR